jgi:NADH:ubiquinone oxidoreductase subunit F (NADH-binding)
MSKQRATQYLIEEIKKDSLVQAKSTEEWNEVFRIAKEMEREQIVNTFKDAQVFQIMEHETRGEQYYNETYGGNNE